MLARRKRPEESRGASEPPLQGHRDMCVGGRGGNKIIHKVLSIELLDFAATLWTYLRRTGLWLL